jgi:hypothetical protein
MIIDHGKVIYSELEPHLQVSIPSYRHILGDFGWFQSYLLPYSPARFSMPSTPFQDNH